QRTEWGRTHFLAKVGFALAESKLRSFAEGRFDPREWHSPFPGPHQKTNEIVEQGNQAGLDTTPPPHLLSSIAGAIGVDGAAAPTAAGSPSRRGERAVDAPDYLPLDEWESYTKTFIKRFQLDEGQKTSATAILKEMRGRAEIYRRGHATEREAMATPLRELFDEFRSRLDGLLTESQRQLSRSGR
ncbi:MAG: hypothetical protein JXQ73_18960, partial [Phycisphaerae bacterium]|nr:hypothetical protein [Phycisphaerae bacterium]